ncbi:hypothetical protein ACP8HI_13065 [Paenibacillus sp. FA6]|uniref:hypothetical protein n=1 Tax=Paenibacillus sp. FA6 TaxID=3413029 RepID=UPI003F65C569
MTVADEFNGEYRPILRSLHSSERELLRVIYMGFAGQLFSDVQFMNLRMLGRSGAEHYLLLISLRKKGRIRAVMKSWGEQLYYIPIEQLPRLHNEFYGHVPKEVKEEFRIVKEAKPGLVFDMFQMLVFIGQDRLLLSAKGFIHKKSIQKMEERVHLRAEDLNQLSLQLRDAGDAPLHIAFLLDLLDCLKLVHRNSRNIVIQEKALSTWLKMSTEQMTSVLVKIVSERYCSYDSDMEHLYCLISQPALLSGQWVEIELLIEGLVEQQLLDRSRTHQMIERATAWVSALAGLGWMDVGILADHRSCFRWRISSDQVLNALFYDTVKYRTSEPESVSTNPFYVQPEFEIIVLPDVPNLLHYKLSMFTSLLISDRMSIYKLTEDSVTQAIQKGIRVKDMISFISVNSEVPAHVLLTLQKWDAEMKPNEDVLNSFPSHRCLEILSVDDEQELGGVGGYNLILEDISRYPYDVNDELPTPQSLFPDLEQIPLRWRKDFRSYHLSTVRQMIEQAILWKTKVKLSFHGNEVDFIPLKVSNNCDIISGEIFNPIIQQYEVTELTCSDWKEMRMVIPEFT